MRILCLLSLLVIMFTSCGKHRYLQIPQGVATQDTLYLKSINEYRLQTNDVLNIKVLTDNENFFTLFNPVSAQQQTINVSDAFLYISGYTVDINGNIEFPEIGKVYVAGLTTREVEEVIYQKVSKIVFDVQVITRLVSFKISIVGEVKSPGEYTVYRDRATIFEALAMAGDMNYYGKRDEIMIYRSTDEGTIPYKIDLTDRKSLSSPVYYLHPNDLIYVQPLPRTVFRFNASDIMTYLSVISTSITLVIAIITLSK